MGYAKQYKTTKRENKVVPKVPKIPKLNLKSLLKRSETTLKDLFYGKSKNKNK
jgi:hypothetical protein